MKKSAYTAANSFSNRPLVAALVAALMDALGAGCSGSSSSKREMSTQTAVAASALEATVDDLQVAATVAALETVAQHYREGVAAVRFRRRQRACFRGRRRRAGNC